MLPFHFKFSKRIFLTFLTWLFRSDGKNWYHEKVENGTTENTLIEADHVYVDSDGSLRMVSDKKEQVTLDRMDGSRELHLRNGRVDYLAADISHEKSKPFKEPVVTQVAAAGTFYPAEDYHQDYYKKNPVRYAYYRRGCGRDARLEQIWGSK